MHGAIPVPEGRDEIHDLAVTLSDAFDSLNEARAATQLALDRQRTFVADASHELRTPLTSLISRLEMLEADTTGESHEDAEASLRSARRMASLVSDLLMIARSDSSARNPEQVTARAVIDAAITDASSALEAHQLLVECDDTVLRCEAAAVSRAIRNLLENADRYGPEAGRIRIQAARGDSAWTLTVDDEGAGIPEDRRQAVFERFARSGGDSAGSTGLGLAIVQAVAEAHQGSVSVGDSDLGGASFRIEFPAAAIA